MKLEPTPAPARSSVPASAIPVRPAAAAPPTPVSWNVRFFGDLFAFHWELQSFRADLFFTIAVGLCLSIGLAAGHPAAGMIAAGGAMTTGFGAKQNIEGTPLLPMLFVTLGMSVSTFIGMVAGHQDYWLLVIATLFGFGYGMLSSRPAGYSWVGQQCVVTLLVASAFPFSPKDAAIRACLIAAGGVVQLLCSALILKAFSRLGGHMRELARYVRNEEVAMRAAYLGALHSVRLRQWRSSALPYALRLAAVLAISTEVYRRLHFASGYWIPMTALLVLRPGVVADTVNRALARTIGTMGGAMLASVFLAYVHPVPVINALLVVLFTWLAYSTLNVNYALYSVSLTSYIVFLLSLADVPGSVIAMRRAVCTLIGGSLALAVRLVVLKRRHAEDKKDRKDHQTPDLGQSTRTA